jgi:hypothetical protein
LRGADNRQRAFAARSGLSASNVQIGDDVGVENLDRRIKACAQGTEVVCQTLATADDPNDRNARRSLMRRDVLFEAWRGKRSASYRANNDNRPSGRYTRGRT